MITDYDTNRWDVVNVDTMAKMFNGATSFDNETYCNGGVETLVIKIENDIANWNVEVPLFWITHPCLNLLVLLIE